MWIAMIVDVPEGTEFENLDADVVNALDGIFAVWTGNPMPGTVPVNGRALIMSKAESQNGNPVAGMEALITLLELDWNILACQTFKEQLLDNTDPENPVYGVSKYMEPDTASIFPHIQPRYSDEAQTIEIPKEMNWANIYQGQAVWAD